MQLKVQFKMFKSLKVKTDKNTQAFFALLKAGLWIDVESMDLGIQGFTESLDWEKVYQLAEEQSVVGLVLAGIEHSYVKPSRDLLLQWIGEVQILEQQNKAKNDFVARLIENLRKADVYSVLVKGQGVAQCYEKPLWRASGDVDLLLSDSNYEKAKRVLQPLAVEVDTEYKSLKHLGLTMKEGFVVELHGMLHSRLSNRIDRGVDEAQNDVFFGGNVRSWMNGSTSVFLPAPDIDVMFIFTHILKHFYIEGIGLRQICDWCRLLWTYRSKLDLRLLESRIRKMGLMSEWKAFATLAVDYLGMPKEAMPFYDSRFKFKGERILEFVLETGNFGYNREIKRSKNYLGGKTQAAWFKMGDFARHAKLFPVDSMKFYCHYLVDGIRQAYAKRVG